MATVDSVPNARVKTRLALAARLGRNPIKKSLSVGNPEATSPVMAAQGPGKETTGMLVRTAA